MPKHFPHPRLLVLTFILLTGAPATRAQTARPAVATAATTTAAAIQRYERLTAELATSVTAYRAATPAFAELAKLNREVVLPWAAQGAPKKPDAAGPSNYNDKSTRPLIQNITGALYKDVYPGFDKLRQGGRIKLAPLEARNFTAMLAFVRTHSILIANPRETRNPYPAGTPAHAAFQRDLTVAVAITGAPLKPLILRLPPELEQKKLAVRELYFDLTKSLPDAEARKIKPFRDPYLEDYVAALTRIEALGAGGPAARN